MSRLVLCVLDGWGVETNSQFDAIHRAHKPTWTFFQSSYPHCQLATSGQSVGLPDGQMGNSEVGHLTIGAGRVNKNDLVKIDGAFSEGLLRTHPDLLGLVSSVKQSGGKCHIMGLYSPGGVHSHSHHFIEIAKILEAWHVPCQYHLFLDGRDTPPRSADTYLADLQEKYPSIYSNIVTLSGRYYAMDRDKRWDRIEKAYNNICYGNPSFSDPLTYIQQAYDNDISDEFIIPGALDPYSGLNPNDVLIFFNFRADRARQILTSLVKKEFKEFNRKSYFPLKACLGFAEYSPDLSLSMPALFRKEGIEQTLGHVISQKGLRQLRIAETEKYAHVTYFFNGGKDVIFEKEDRLLVPSPAVATYDLFPDMSAPQITQSLVAELETQQYDFVLVNYANADMVGHTGDLSAAIKAIECIDSCLKTLYDSCRQNGYDLLITADHGNAECMFDEHNQENHTAHTLGPVPMVVVPFKADQTFQLSDGSLTDVAPTILDLMGINKPAQMTGQSLIKTG